jgi:hypothetical protein
MRWLLYYNYMGNFERGPLSAPKVADGSIEHAQEELRVATERRELLARTLGYQEARLSELLPLLREEAGLQVYVELQGDHVRALRTRDGLPADVASDGHSSASPELIEAEREYAEVTAALATASEKVRRQDADLLSRFGLGDDDAHAA